MKFKNIALSVLSLSMLALTSCSEGKYWDSPKSYGEAYAFAKPSLTVEIPADDEMPTVYNVPVTRADASQEATIEVTFSTTSDCLSGPSTITFEKGSLKADYPISINTSLVEAGFDYAATVTLAKVEDGLISVEKNNLKLDFKIRHELILIWEDAGVAQVTSSWAENSSPVEVPVQQAVNYPDSKKSLFRLVSPYWYLQPEVATEGYNIEFICYKGSAYRADTLPDGWQAMGETDVDEEGTPINLFIGMPADSESSFKSSKNRYSLKCAIGFSEYEDPSDDEVTVSDVMETFTFTWIH